MLQFAREDDEESSHWPVSSPSLLSSAGAKYDECENEVTLLQTVQYTSF